MSFADPTIVLIMVGIRHDHVRGLVPLACARYFVFEAELALKDHLFGGFEVVGVVFHGSLLFGVEDVD